MKTIRILIMLTALMVSVSCGKKKEKEAVAPASGTSAVHEGGDHSGHDHSDHDGHDHGGPSAPAAEGGDPVLDTTAVQRKTPKKPDIVAYRDPLANVTFANKRITDVFKYYAELKTTLVNGDVERAINASSYLMMAYANIGVDVGLLNRANTISMSQDIEEQRAAFQGVTDDVLNLIQGNLTSGKVYKKFCPMAFDNKGAYWLSSEKEIENPYFGEQMLRCGEIQETIQ